MFENFIFFLLVLLATYFANKKNFLPNFTGDTHQKFFKEKKIPLIGGTFVLICLFRVFINDNLFIHLVFLCIFFIGFLSDTKLLSSPKLRLFLQLIFVLFFVLYFKIEVTPTKIEFVDLLLENKYLSFLFSIFCFMILINGSNFIDGLNGLLLGYILLILFILNSNNLIILNGVNEIERNFLFFSLILIIILNYLNFLYLGDGGAYLLGVFIGYVLVSIYNSQLVISPYYVILLLWYPCFENLFSLLRKYFKSESPIQADNKHLHQLIFLFLKSKIKSKNNIIISIISSLTINAFNLIIFLIGSKNPNLTPLQVKLILVSAFIYCLVYFFLNKRFYSSLKK